jgi:putative hydrolase of HD superfamily
MGQKPDINRVLEFQEFLAAFAQVDRMVHRAHKSKYIFENDTEHSFNLAMTAWFLAEYFKELDKNKVIRLALVHDLVEVHAGDTYIYGDQVHLDSQKKREAVALKKIKDDWYDYPDLAQTIEEYERRDSKEAKFVYALDKIMPVMLIIINQGYSWQKNEITLEMIDEAKRHKVTVSPEIKPYYDQLYDFMLEHRHFFAKK